MKQAAKKTQKKADMPRSLQLKNSSQEASSQEDPKEGSQETSSQETSSLFARFLHAFWTLLHAFFGSRRANPLQETKRFVYSLSSSWDLFRKNITITLWSRFEKPGLFAVHPELYRRTPGTLQAFTRRSPGVHPAFIRRSPGVHPAFTRRSPGGVHPAFTRRSPGTGWTQTHNSSGSHRRSSGSSGICISLSTLLSKIQFDLQ